MCINRSDLTFSSLFTEEEIALEEEKALGGWGVCPGPTDSNGTRMHTEQSILCIPCHWYVLVFSKTGKQVEKLW